MTSIETDQGLENYVALKLPIQVPESDQDFYVVIDQGNEFRIDVLSAQVYDGNPNYGWALLEVNGLRSCLELTSQTRIRVPPIDAIELAVRESHDRI